MKILNIRYGQVPGSDAFMIGHDQTFKNNPKYLYVPECHKPEKNFLAASQALCIYLSQHPEYEVVNAKDSYEILYYLCFHQAALKIRNIDFAEVPVIYPGKQLFEIFLVQEARAYILKYLGNQMGQPAEREFRLSICMTTFNRIGELEEALIALTNQSETNFELIVINDGSTEAKVLEFHQQMRQKYFAYQPNWKWVDQENTYLGMARNNAAKVASGNCLLFLDDDNIPEKNMVEIYKKNWLYQNYKVFVSSFKIFYEGRPGAFNHWYPFPTAGYSRTLANIVSDAQCLIDKDLFWKLGGYSTDKGIGFEDWEFFLKVLQTEKMFPIYESLYMYRVHEQDNSMRKNTKAFLNNQRGIRPLQAAYPRLARSFLQNIAHFNSHNYLSTKKS
jgi:glycosyltransferase involved in cell wall biosynthesis